MWLQGAWLSKSNSACAYSTRSTQTAPTRRAMSSVLLAAASACTSTCSSPAARLVPSARLPPASLSGRARCSVSMVVDSVESTPNPSSFLLRLDAAPEGLAATGLRGQTFYGGDLLCPPAMAAALATEGVESIFACGNMLTVNKVAAAQWEAVLTLTLTLTLAQTLTLTLTPTPTQTQSQTLTLTLGATLGSRGAGWRVGGAGRERAAACTQRRCGRLRRVEWRGRDPAAGEG